MVALLSVLYGLIAIGCANLFFGNKLRNQSTKVALLKIFDTLQPGQSLEDALTLYHKEKTTRLLINTNTFTQAWVLRMPFELGSADLQLFILFNNQRTITALCMRTSDGIHAHPRNGPPDKGPFEEAKVRTVGTRTERHETSNPEK